MKVIFLFLKFMFIKLFVSFDSFSTAPSSILFDGRDDLYELTAVSFLKSSFWLRRD